MEWRVGKIHVKRKVARPGDWDSDITNITNITILGYLDSFATFYNFTLNNLIKYYETCVKCVDYCS